MPLHQQRPISPHLSLWRWRVWAITSIVHRICAFGLYFVGMPIATWFLCALALGPKHHALFIGFAGSWFGQFLLIGLTWAVLQHMASGMRHLLMDTGAAFGRAASRWSAAACFIVSIVLTAATWLLIWLWH